MGYKILTNYGCAVDVVDGVLLSAPLSQNGEVVDDWGEVTAPESEAFINEINALFGTDFNFFKFPGR